MICTKPMALGAARLVLCGRWGLCNSCRNTVLYPKSVHIYTPANAWAHAWAHACGLACAFWWRVLRPMAGTVACALQHTPWHTPAACGHGVCWRLHGRCLRLHGRCHGRCFAAHAMAHATGSWPWRVLALAWQALWRVLCSTRHGTRQRLVGMACAGACMAGACAYMAGAMAGALQHTPWHTPLACGHGVCWRLHGVCWRLHGVCWRLHGVCWCLHGMCQWVAGAMAGAAVAGCEYSSAPISTRN
jgi:hypothetical protein